SERPSRHHVRRKIGRRSADGGAVFATSPSLHPAPDRQPAETRRHTREPQPAGLAAQPGRSTRGLPLPSALSAGDGRLPARGAAPAAGRRGPSRRLLRREPAVMTALLELDGVIKAYRRGGPLLGQRFRAVDGVSLTIGDAGPEIFAVIGESGSGK